MRLSEVRRTSTGQPSETPHTPLLTDSLKETLNKLLRRPSALSRARSPLAYLRDMSRVSLRGFAQLGVLITLIQSFLKFIPRGLPRDP